MLSKRRQANYAVSILLSTIFLIGVVTGAGTATQSANASAPLTRQSTNSESTLVLRVYFKDVAERDRLATELGAMEASTLDGYLTLWASRPTYERLLKRGLNVVIDEKATEQVRRFAYYGLGGPDTFYGGYKTVEEMVAFLDEKVAAYPTLAEKVDIGDTWCKTHPGLCLVPTPFGGNDLWVLHITNQSIPGPKPVFWFDAGVHSREIATPEVAMRFINMLLDEYATNADSRWLVDYHDIWVMPMHNPDGHHVVEQGVEEPFTQRKNLDNDDGCPVYPPTDFAQLGVDLNRNYPFKWGCCGGSSTIACDLTYRGPSAASEEEVQAVMAKIRTLIPDQRGPNDEDMAPLTTTGVLQTMHSVANLNLYPWGHTGEPSPNNADLRNIGAHMSALNAGGNNSNSGGNGYRYGQPPNILYSVDGDEVSWGYGELGLATFTTEVSGESFFPTYSCIDEPGCGSARGIWPENKGMLTYLAKIARTPYLTTRGPDTNNPTTTPMTVTVGVTSYLSATINHAWTGNNYNQTIAAAEYYIDTPPWAGGTAIPMGAVDGNFDSATEEVEANISTASLPVGRHIIFVRGRGVNSYEGFPSWGPISAVFLDVSLTGASATPTVTGTPPTATSTRTPLPPTATRTPTITPTPIATSCAVNVLLSETFESGTLGVFTSTTTLGSSPWDVVTGTVGSGLYAAGVADPNEQADQQLTQVNAVTIPSGAISAILQFQQSYSFEQPDFDGGVLEYTTNNGVLWQDAGSLITQAGYTGVITVASGNPLSGRPAWVREMPGYPSYQVVTANLMSLQGMSVRFRFRMGSDLNSGAEGWRVDDIYIVVTQPCGTGTPPPGTSTPTGTGTAVSGTPTACAVSFTDVPPDHPFYIWIRCLACRGIISGYSDGTFRPYNDITRGQIAKIVSNSAGFNDEIPPEQQTFTDVPPVHPFWPWIERLTLHEGGSIITGYPCGGELEPCDLENRPYFRPSNTATRGQLSKIVATGAGITEPIPDDRQTYADVPIHSTFWLYIEQLTALGVVGGYPCGGEGEPCDDQDRPYFRPYTNVTRGQAAKIVANTFFPDCQTP